LVGISYLEWLSDRLGARGVSGPAFRDEALTVAHLHNRNASIKIKTGLVVDFFRGRDFRAPDQTPLRY
jgi:hypothetical protein